MKRIAFILLALTLVVQTWAQDDPPYYFKGLLNGRIQVEIAFETGNHNIVAGYIYYPKAKNPAPILIAGHISYDDTSSDVYFREFQPDGTVTGHIHFSFTEVEGDYEFVSGQWTNPKTLKDMPFSRMASQFRKPAWYPSSPLTPEDPGNIGREYSYTFWNSNYKAMMGGEVSFKAAGKNRLHFSVSNCPQNNAEGDSDPDRPAVLKGNEFEYSNVNECHYGFRATFFPLFVVLETTEGTDELHKCFGLGATFDGIYIKQKQ